MFDKACKCLENMHRSKLTISGERVPQGFFKSQEKAFITQVLPITKEGLTTGPEKFFSHIIIFILLIIINIIYTY